MATPKIENNNNQLEQSGESENHPDIEQRFQVELEFVQCLANPWYLNFLAQQSYFEQKEFVNYLKYLKYWKRPEYAKFIIYPHCLYFLDLLQHEEFRQSIKSIDAATFIHSRQYYHWLYSNRPKVDEAKNNEQENNDQSQADNENMAVKSEANTATLS
ncbi:SOH1-domain-containing protein [Conidiobolus coronatus NRRL 28638]|uniref:Mediator of RNA polymerase II transcription subunit 31 n=1 Tax=Conidiobolus coronatus (strain ATCC 28846 / CBS 209.66 / NRRL 28638) TaxID=796925 RepID=A0A137PIQ0_CONC2|nr:SOH1-domain-containing protein [Conidiobolus coronatus NRRL 28638]|eukprot:KXN74873.1 SOH1-domain-containing protein [Conidiobolus coronatus NRRL 28638]